MGDPGIDYEMIAIRRQPYLSDIGRVNMRRSHCFSRTYYYMLTKSHSHIFLMSSTVVTTLSYYTLVEALLSHSSFVVLGKTLRRILEGGEFPATN